MDRNIVYHGSNVEVATPRILQNGFYKDFGYGFYCTNYEKQAKRWAMTRKGASVVNRYKYISDMWAYRYLVRLRNWKIRKNLTIPFAKKQLNKISV